MVQSIRGKFFNQMGLVGLLAVLVVVPVCLWAASGGSGDEDRSPTSFQKAQDAVEEEQFEEAIRTLRTVLDEKPDHARAHNLLGYSYRKTGNLKKSIDHYHRALDLRSDFPRAREYLGKTYLKGVLAQIEKLEQSDEPEASSLKEQLENALLEATKNLDRDSSTSESPSTY